MNSNNLSFKKLDVSTVSAYTEYAKKVIKAEPFLNEVECVDEQAVLKRLSDEFFKSSESLLAYKDGAVVGRLEYHFFGCPADGAKMAYIGWICVLKSERHCGIGQALFKEFEKECKNNGIEQYFLVAAENSEAASFYNAFKNAEIKTQPVLRKNV